MLFRLSVKVYCRDCIQSWVGLGRAGARGSHAPGCSIGRSSWKVRKLLSALGGAKLSCLGGARS